MSEWIKCDNCGNDRENETATATFKWLHVERAMTVVGEPADLDFCSWSCMENYAGAKRIKEAERAAAASASPATS